MVRDNYFRLIVLAFLFLLMANVGWGADTDICLNSLGFLPEIPKRATIAAKCSVFEVKNVSSGKTVYTGTAEGPLHQDNVKQDVWIADFSQVKTKGKYYLDVPDVGRSIEFEINDNVYNDAYYAVMRGFYLWRCGTAVKGKHNNVLFSQEACHLEDAWQDYMGINDTKRDGTKGWHDAGDYGKYTVNAGVTLGVLFLAWDHFQDRLEDIRLDLPETAPGYPDFLKELKWETDWLLKMQYPDGSGKVSHKLTRLNFSGFIMPSNDTEKRYFTDWGSAATADFVAVMAMAARYFKPNDSDYAKTCLEAAEKSYTFLKNNPKDERPDQRAFSTGGYGTSDGDDRLWAAAEMWETTGQESYLKDFEERVRLRRELVEEDWDWGSVGNLGIFTYVLSKKSGRDLELVKKNSKALSDTADRIVEQAKKDVYARPLGGQYYWGCNGSVARQVVTLQTAYKVSPKPEYIHTSLDAIGHLFGRNYYGRSYVTGVGHNPPMYPHDRRSGADGIKDPWPGYIVGGGHSATGWHDVQDDYRTNEIAINWQAALVYALAGFTGE